MLGLIRALLYNGHNAYESGLKCAVLFSDAKDII